MIIKSSLYKFLIIAGTCLSSSAHAFSALADHVTHDNITCTGEYKNRAGKIVKFTTFAESETPGLPPQILKLAVEGEKERSLGANCYSMDHVLGLRGRFPGKDLSPILERASQVSVASSSYRLRKVDVGTANQVVNYVQNTMGNPTAVTNPSEGDAYNLTFEQKPDFMKDFRMIFGEQLITPGQQLPAKLEISSLHFEDVQPSRLVKVDVVCTFQPRN